MKTFHRLIIFFLYFHKCVPVDSSKNIITEVEKKIILPCGVVSKGDIAWLKNGASVLKYIKNQKYTSNLLKDSNRFNVYDHSFNK
ncbi:unnamed protein product [Staurois parvus]|uniref:Uncharacterized protein n=1 Tax=Staurois parvus TaxID=386267 RepID=A0ABN9DR34_9NEOB|nr:unnamed protein product [Staurois parvus]